MNCSKVLITFLRRQFYHSTLLRCTLTTAAELSAIIRRKTLLAWCSFEFRAMTRWKNEKVHEPADEERETRGRSFHLAVNTVDLCFATVLLLRSNVYGSIKEQNSASEGTNDAEELGTRRTEQFLFVLLRTFNEMCTLLPTVLAVLLALRWTTNIYLNCFVLCELKWIQKAKMSEC